MKMQIMICFYHTFKPVATMKKVTKIYHHIIWCSTPIYIIWFAFHQRSTHTITSNTYHDHSERFADSVHQSTRMNRKTEKGKKAANPHHLSVNLKIQCENVYFNTVCHLRDQYIILIVVVDVLLMLIGLGNAKIVEPRSCRELKET